MNDSDPRRHHLQVLLPLGVAFVFFAGLLAFAFLVGIHRTHALVYSLDDPYIHLTIARHLANGEGFSFDGHSFSSASSSPLWVAALALGMRVGIAAEFAPLVLVVLSGLALLGASAAALHRAGLGPVATTVALLAEIVLVPMVPVASTGLEHLLHAAFAVALLDWFGRGVAARDVTPVDGRGAGLAVGALIAALGSATRFEFAFEVVAVVLGFVLLHRYREAAVLAVAGALPVVVYGCVARLHGAPFLPYSVLLKASLPRPGAASVLKLFGVTAYRTLAVTPHLLVLVLVMLCAVVMLARRERETSRRELAWLGVVLTTLALHLQFAKTGWFHRYEAYLMVLSGLALAGCWSSIRPWVVDVVAGGRSSLGARLAACALLVAVSAPLVPRAFSAHLETPRAMRNIHEQQRQMARFFRTAFAGQAVVVNDVGLVGFEGRVRVVDLMGLATDEVARARLRRSLDTATIRRVTGDAGARVAAIYAERFVGRASVPAAWVRVGEWTISDNVVCGGPTVAFYSVDQAGAASLAAALRRFSSQLPPEVSSRIVSPGD